MSSNQKITRSDHVASLILPPGRVAQVLGNLQRRDVLLRIGLCLAAAFCMWMLTGGWKSPLRHRLGDTPLRHIAARVGFDIPDLEGTLRLRERKRGGLECVYVHDPRLLEEMRSSLKGRLFDVMRAPSFDELNSDVWGPFVARDENWGTADDKAAFARLRAALAGDSNLTRVARAVECALAPYEATGLIEKLEHLPEEGSQIAIRVRTVSNPTELQHVAVARVRIAEVTEDIKRRLEEEVRRAGFAPEHVGPLTTLLHTWCVNQGFPTTLKFDRDTTQRVFDQELAKVVALKHYAVGDPLVRGGNLIGPEAWELLRAEHAVVVENMSGWSKLGYSLASWGMYIALYLLCGVFIFYHRPVILADLRKLSTLLATLVLTVTLARLCAGELWQAEVVPIVLFGMTLALAYSRDLALILSTAVALLLCVALGMSLADFVLMAVTAAAAILPLNRVRSRTKLIYVGLGAAAVATVTTLGIGTLLGETLGGWSGRDFPLINVALPGRSMFLVHLAGSAVWHGFCALLAGMIMTGLLPVIERLFDVLTDISLLELGDAAQPLLQELARRAPGTYNHSINVASLSEAAAESIGANGLLVRVGSYFHDIGKMFKPGYFVENQGGESNRHESLVPAMSTLVIIAHVKDGADLARQNRLPQRIIDFIEQHHGTTLVEYFYRQATKQSESDPDRNAVEESSYRYPGPKPQTREAAVLMLADAVESASRTLVDPTPARIENLVEEIALKKLLDGQFDECGITLLELSCLRNSLVKSLTAVYHARIKYPDQRTA